MHYAKRHQDEEGNWFSFRPDLGQVLGLTGVVTY